MSLLSKFRTFLTEEKILRTDFDVYKMNIGDFIEVEGELQKNPLIDCMDKFTDVFRMAEIFSSEPELGNKTQAKAQKKQEQAMVKQIQSFSDELKHSGTIDFVLSDIKGTWYFLYKSSIYRMTISLKFLEVGLRFWEK